MGLKHYSLDAARLARWPNGPATPTCHPDRPNRARGLCARCYGSALRRARYLVQPELLEAERERGRAHIKRHPDKPRRDWLRLAYGVALEDVAAMLEAQDGRCLICHRDDVRLSVDHDHQTGRVRGLLCNNCNAGIGFLGDDPARLLDAVVYLTSDRQGEA